MVLGVRGTKYLGSEVLGPGSLGSLGSLGSQVPGIPDPGSVGLGGRHQNSMSRASPPLIRRAEHGHLTDQASVVAGAATIGQASDLVPVPGDACYQSILVSKG